MSDPQAATIARTGRGTRPDDGADGGPARWAEIEERLRAGEATMWLSVRGPDGVHTRPLFAAWEGEAFVLASKAGAVKTALLDADPRCSLALELGDLHVVVDGVARRLTAPDDLERAARAMREVYDWPAEPAGDELDAPYGAPTSGGPPYRAYEVRPVRAFAFPTRDQVEPTRFTFGDS